MNDYSFCRLNAKAKMTMKKYKLVSKKGEGTFSEVVKAENIENGKFYAIKCMKNSFKNLQQVRYEWRGSQ